MSCKRTDTGGRWWIVRGLRVTTEHLQCNRYAAVYTHTPTHTHIFYVVCVFFIVFLFHTHNIPCETTSPDSNLLFKMAKAKCN